MQTETKAAIAAFVVLMPWSLVILGGYALYKKYRKKGAKRWRRRRLRSRTWAR